MDMTLEKLRLTLVCLTLLIGLSHNVDPTDEPSEVTGDYTIRIKVWQNGEISNASHLQFSLLGEIYVKPYPLKYPCKDSEIPLSDFADIGRLCTIELKLADRPPKPCAIKTFVIVDNVREEETTFNVMLQLKGEEQTFPRSDLIKLKWNEWGPGEECNCTSKTHIRRRTCPLLSNQCQNLSTCEGPTAKTDTCVCINESKEDEGSPTAIAIIVCVVAVLVILVLAAVCYSRRMQKRKAKEEARKSKISYPIIVVSPPEESESETTKALLSGGIQHVDMSPIPCKLVTPEDSPDDDVKKPPYPIEWEENDLYVSGDTC